MWKRLHDHRNHHILSVLVMGLCILVVVGAWTVHVVQAQDDDPPNLGAPYAGSQECERCHNDDDAPLWNTWNRTFHAQTIRLADEPISPHTFEVSFSISISSRRLVSATNNLL